MIEAVCIELESMDLDRAACAAVRARLWRAGNLLRVAPRKPPEKPVP